MDNALFISDPGGWDDDMLWTMSVSPDPHRDGGWRMFYTGLSMADRGRVQRIGLARSDDLFTWEKDATGAFPLELGAAPYEHSLEQGRHWVSFRDPYYARIDGTGYLLAAARVDHGPVIRRGAVALFEETAPDRFEPRQPLFHPSRYDDIEVPVPVQLDGRWYLLGSIREDVKVHYWYAEAFEGPYLNFSDNVLLPQGNYAARLCRDDGRWLVWNFFFKGHVTDGQHLLPPPKELRAAPDGELYLASFSGFDARVRATLAGGRADPAGTAVRPRVGRQRGGVGRGALRLRQRLRDFPGAGRAPRLPVARRAAHGRQRQDRPGAASERRRGRLLSQPRPAQGDRPAPRLGGASRGATSRRPSTTSRCSRTTTSRTATRTRSCCSPTAPTWSSRSTARCS